jgi:hypothetical protein
VTMAARPASVISIQSLPATNAETAFRDDRKHLVCAKLIARQSTKLRTLSVVL